MRERERRDNVADYKSTCDDYLTVHRWFTLKGSEVLT